MSDAVLGALVSASLIGTGIFLLHRDPSKLSGRRATPAQLRRGGHFGILGGVLMAGLTIYIYLRNLK